MKSLLKEIESHRHDAAIATMAMLAAVAMFAVILVIGLWYPRDRAVDCPADGVVMRMNCRMGLHGLLETCDEVCARESVGW